MDRLGAFARRLSRGIKDPAYRKDVEDEVLDHLVSAVQHLEADGVSREDAIHKVMQDFGDPVSIARFFPAKSEDPVSSVKRGAIYGALFVTWGLLVWSLVWGLSNGYFRNIPLVGWVFFAQRWLLLISIGAVIGAPAGLVWHLTRRRTRVES